MTQATATRHRLPTAKPREAVEAGRWEHLAAYGADTTLDELVKIRQAIEDHAEAISGRTIDADVRAEEYWALYEASGGSFMFPLVATHGSLWGVSHTRRIDTALARIRPLSRHGRVDRWAEAIDAVRDVNRRVFVEIYTTFWFTRYLGRHPLASQLVNPGVLARYNEVHAACSEGRVLDRKRRRAVYYEVFAHEQHTIVDPGLRDAAALAASPVLERFLKHVRPRFRYFPPGERLRFTDFTSLVQRNREGLRALEFAEEVGPQRVHEAMSEYP